MSQLFIDAVTQSRLNLKQNYKNYTRHLYTCNTHHLGLYVAFSFTIAGLKYKMKQNNLTKNTRQPIIWHTLDSEVDVSK